MKVSTKTRYGLRAIIYLAKTDSDVCPLKEIAQAQDISFDYLEKIIAKLRKADLVESRRGAQGGYKLSRQPKNIKVGEIVRALEGDNLVECLKEEEFCSQAEDCLAKEVWQKLQNSLNKALDSISLKDLIS